MENSMLSRGMNYSLGKLGALAPRPARYDEGGTVSDNGVVNPNAFMQWPNQSPHPQQSFEAGGITEGDDSSGQADPTALIDPSGMTDPATANLVAHSRKVYDGIHAKLEQQFNAGQQPQQSQFDPQQASSDNDADDQGYAGGGLIAPPGPAGAGVKPQTPTGNAGRPNWTAPNPKETASEKNYAQNVTSRPATSPARGTSFSPAGPDGGQRGQEWYGKGSSPYGAGRKKQNG
jgi:hypothetical protein